jgi:hypothetical protein
MYPGNPTCIRRMVPTEEGAGVLWATI